MYFTVRTLFQYVYSKSLFSNNKKKKKLFDILDLSFRDKIRKQLNSMKTLSKTSLITPLKVYLRLPRSD